MNEHLSQELETIRADIQEYFRGPVVRGPEGLKANKAVKSKLSAFIEKVKEDDKLGAEEKTAFTRKAIIMLAENTGSHIDNQVATEILENLLEKKYLSEEDISAFNNHSGTRRWE